MAKRNTRSRSNASRNQWRISAPKKNGYQLLKTPSTYKPQQAPGRSLRSPSAEPLKVALTVRQRQERLKKQQLLAEQSSDKARRKKKLVCKERPDSKQASRGTGGSKKFVPWCDRRG